MARDVRKCPFCAEEIKPEAVLCKHCKSQVTPEIRSSIDEHAQHRQAYGPILLVMCAMAIISFFMYLYIISEPQSVKIAKSHTEALKDVDAKINTAKADGNAMDKSLALELVIDLPQILGKSEAEVAGLLGKPNSCSEIKYGRKCIYGNSSTEIVFINGKADWIAVNNIEGAPLSKDSLALLGLTPTTPDFSNQYTMEWRNRFDCVSVQFAPGAIGKIWYAYIKHRTL